MRWRSVAAGAVLACLAAPLHGQGAAADSLVGLWGAEATFGPQVRGELVLARGEGGWTARVGGFEAPAQVAGDSVRVSLAGGQGDFRGRFEDGGRSVRGFWIQTPGSYRYATPVTLRRAGDGAWRGTLDPLDDRISLYLNVVRAPDGSLRGSFHNPDRNWSGGAAWFRVGLDSGAVTLADTATGRVRFRQAYDAGRRTIAMDFGAPFVLTPRTPDQAAGFRARPPGQAPYAYRPPVADGDGWPVARAASVGLDETVLRDFVRWIAEMDPATPNAPRIHSLLVARHGKLVLEEYFFGFAADQRHDLRSASKTITSVMAGVAIDQGRLSIDTPVLPLLGSGDPAKARITLAHLLTHTSGLACDDDDSASPGNEDTMQEQAAQPDWLAYTRDLPVAHAPGSVYAYCSGGINLAGGAVAAATGTWLPEFFDRNVARPLGITRYAYNLMPTGEGYGGGGIYLRPRDLMKLGQTFLDGGTWQGRRIVSRRWVEASTARHVDVPGGSTDGYAWHRFTLEHDGRRYEEYEASGNGGQMMIVVPELNLVVVITAGNYNRFAIWRTFRERLVPGHVIAAVRD